MRLLGCVLTEIKAIKKKKKRTNKKTKRKTKLAQMEFFLFRAEENNRPGAETKCLKHLVLMLARGLHEMS